MLKSRFFRFSRWGQEGRETLRHWKSWFDSVGIKSGVIQDPETGLTALYRNGYEWPTTPEEDDVAGGGEG